MAMLSDLMARRERIANAIQVIQSTKADVARISQEGQTAATAAAMWAAVMMVTDILKIGMSASNKQAAAGFATIDALVAKADQLMQLFGARPMTTKADLMRQVDPNLQNAATVVGYVRQARGKIDEAAKAMKVPRGPATALGQWDLVARIGVEMADDTILILQAGQTQSAVGRSAAAQQAQIDRTLNKLRQQLSAVDAALVQLLDRARMA
jgi:hypothetical protein